MIKHSKMLQQLAASSLLINQNSPVEQWSEIWLETIKKGNMTDKSFATYRQKLLPVIGSQTACGHRDRRRGISRNQATRHRKPDNLYGSLTSYHLRHTYCAELQDTGAPTNVAKYLMGHSDITVTANIYTHTSEEMIRQAAELI